MMAAKLMFAIELLKTYGIMIPRIYSKHLTDGIFELRIKYSSNISRILYFFIKDDSAVLTNGFIKKIVLTPIKEIEIAKKRRKNYLQKETK